MDNKTIRELAEELNVSKQAIRKRLTPEFRKRFAVTNGNQITISPKGVSLIYQSFTTHSGGNANANVTGNQFANSQTQVTDFSHLETYIQSLENQLQKKDDQLQQQAEAKDLQIANLQKLLDQQQQLLQLEQKKNQLFLEEAKQESEQASNTKSHFFKRLFSRS
ncbi:DNA-binding protein [Listeria valentina]|uniref:DNA-binding protein n=1 Tax=Listeria valentina TaxID=2705293 RepID=UPI0014322B57|nr:DNA-binding protein [Listeria valentina]